MISTLPFNTETAFDCFELPRRDRRRKLDLGEVLPKFGGEHYCVLMTDFEIEIGGEVVAIDSLDTLFSRFGLDRSEKSLLQILEGKVLHEGAKCVARDVSRRLMSAKDEPGTLFVRCSDPPEKFLWQLEFDEFFRSDDMLKTLPHPFGEFEVTDERGTWYLRVRDENPLIFLAGPDLLVARLDRECPSFAMKLTGDFTYAL